MSNMFKDLIKKVPTPLQRVDWTLGHRGLDGITEPNPLWMYVKDQALVLICASILIAWVLVVSFQFSGNITQILTAVIGPSVSWLALTYTARSYANQTKWKKQDLFLAQLASDLLSKPFKAILKVMQQANAITPIYLMPEDLTAANFTKDKYVSVSRGDLEAVFTPMGYEFEYTAVQQDLRRYLRHFLASMYCYNQLRRQNAFADFEFLVALRFRTISLCYSHSIFADSYQLVTILDVTYVIVRVNDTTLNQLDCSCMCVTFAIV